jgi:hypothetical protein
MHRNETFGPDLKRFQPKPPGLAQYRLAEWGKRSRHPCWHGGIANTCRYFSEWVTHVLK